MLRVALLLLLLGVGGAAHCGEMADATRRALEAGRFAEGETQLAAAIASDPTDDEARLGLGLVRVAEALERFGQAQRRYGLRLDPILTHLEMFGMSPGFRAGSADPKSKPWPRLDYARQRAILQSFLDDLARVEDALAGMGDRPAKIALDLDAIQFRAAPDAATDPSLTLGAILQASQDSPGAPGRSSAPPPFAVVFDRADGIWLRAYAQLISAALELALAYDWRESFERYGGLFYEGAREPRQPWDRPSVGNLLLDDELFDLIGFIHSIRWRCAEPDRVRAAKRHLKAVVALNRQMWPLVLARTGDDRNWIAGPQQRHAAMTSLPITQDLVDAWRDDIETFDAVLDGNILLPHWRYAWGLDLSAVLDKPQDFDALDWLSGAATIPFLRQGPMIDSGKWATMTEPFGPNFLAYSLWLN